MKDVLGSALLDYYHNTNPQKLWIHNQYGPKEEMPVSIYFRQQMQMPELELQALSLCKGAVLDIGAGAGSHTLVLQQQGMDVTALEVSPGAVKVMQERGVQKIINTDIFDFAEQRFDTLLLLMNGIGLTGTIAGLRTFLQHAKKLLNKGGQLLFDSSDVAYLYNGKLPLYGPYYGEIAYQYEYKKQKTEPFTWLYIDAPLLVSIAAEEGWQATLLGTDMYDQYLAKLVLV